MTTTLTEKPAPLEPADCATGENWTEVFTDPRSIHGACVA